MTAFIGGFQIQFAPEIDCINPKVLEGFEILSPVDLEYPKFRVFGQLGCYDRGIRILNFTADVDFRSA